MKKLVKSALALATILFASSCMQESLEPAQNGSTVTFTVEAPETVATKALFGDGTNINNLVYAVYKTEENDLETAASAIKPEDKIYDFIEDVSFEDRKTTVSLELINDQKYIVLFWAQHGQTWIQKNKEFDLTNITYPTHEPLLANNDKYSAFSGAAFVEKVDGARTEKVTLTRPFAQINIAAADPVRYDVNVTASRVTVINAGAKFNVATQLASDKIDVVYGEAAIPGGGFNGYDHYVAMNYVFATGNVKVAYEIVTDHGTISTYDAPIENVPVAKNYRTNIVGNLLTSSVDYNVELDQKWGTPENEVKVVSNASELQEAINNAFENEEIALNGDINLSELFESLTRSTTEKKAYVEVPAGKTVVLNLNGYSITSVDETDKAFGLIVNKGNLTVINTASKQSSLLLKATTNSGWSRYSSVISNQVGATLLVKGNVLVEHLGGTDMAYAIDNLTNGKGTSAIAVVDGATIKSTYRPIRQFLNGVEANNSLTVKANSVIQSTNGNKSIWMQDPSKNANSGSLVVEKGAYLMTDAYLDVTEGSTEWPVSVSIAASALQGEATVISENVPAGYKVELVDGIWTVNFYPVAKIGEKGYAKLIDAVAAVQDGETITLVADEIFTKDNYYDNGGWKDGLGYSGDKSFTIDLGGNTIKQDGSLNDYLVWIKNDGAKANTITFKNGTMDAGKTAYCAIATASTNAQKLTVNLENIDLINNISNGAVVKARGGSELNVKAGTVITGKNSYTGIEAVGNNTVVNIYEGAEIYQYGTSSDVGAIVGASYNATLNIYGGKGKSAKCGIIVMSTGATINVSGGEWTANGDGTVAAGNNGVLVSQNNRYESGWACKSVLNVTGGTFKGGYDCWGMGPGQEPDDAQINIKGGNFNADPKSYVVNGYKAVESNGVYNVVVDPVAIIGTTEYATLQEALNVGGNVTLLRNVTITEPATLAGGKTAVLDLNGKTLTAELTSGLVSEEESNLTVKNGKVVAYESTVRAIGGKVIVESGEYTSTGTALDSPATYRYSLDCREGGELIINGGTFKSNNGLINVSSKVTVNGGKFENIVEKTMTRHLAYVSALLTINGGEFSGQANGSAGGCFFCGAASGCDIQVNGGKFTSLWTSGKVNRIFEVYSTGASINVTGGMFNTNGGITNFVVANTDEATKDAYPYVAK